MPVEDGSNGPMNGGSRGYRVLIVEDEPMQAMTLEAIVQSGGYAVSTSENGRAAIESMKQSLPDIILSDVLMPEMGGYDLCRTIRADRTLAGVRIILLTSQSEPADVLRGLEAGADNFMAKPYDADEVLLRVAETLAEAPVEREGGIDVQFQGVRYSIPSTRSRILNFFLSAYKEVIHKNAQLTRVHKDLEFLNKNLSKMVGDRTSELREEVNSRKKAEAESRERAELLDKARDAIVLMDLNGTIQYCNKSTEEFYGWPGARMVGQTAASLFYDSEHPFPAEAMTITKEKGEWVGELRQVTMNHQELIVLSSFTLVCDAQRRPCSILSISTNITEKKKLETKFLRTQRLENIGALAGGVAHDLNNLMAPILLAVGLLQRKTDDPGVLSTLKIVESSAGRAVGIVRQLLTFARGSGDEPVLLQPKHIIKETLQLVHQSFPPAIEARADYPPDLMTVMGDPTQLHQVLMNLCVNARDAMPQGGSLMISAQNLMLDEAFVAMYPEAKTGPYVVLRVKDTGSGIPPEIREKIFEPFFTTKDPGKGTGLGLSTVQSIVRSNGGFLGLESEQGKGTEFQIYLPAVAGGQEVEALTQERQAHRGNGETLLCVDDEETVLEMMKATLEGSGYRVIAANDGTHALAEFVSRKDEIAAIIVDLAMPHLDGLSTIRTMLRLDARVRIIAMSGHDDAFQKAKATLDKSIPILRKPFTVDRLLVSLRQVLLTKPDIDSSLVA